MESQMLLEVTEVIDDDTGIWHMGEVEFGISGNLETYLLKYGEKGRDDILAVLNYLKEAVSKKCDELIAKKQLKALVKNRKE